MSTNLSSFIKSLLPSFSKSDIESDLEISLEYIPVIVDNYNNLAAAMKVESSPKFHNKEVQDLIKTFYKEMSSSKTKVKLRKNNFPLDMVTLFNNAKPNGEWLLKEISDGLNDVVMSQALNTYNANLMRSVPHFYFVTKYATDLLSFIYIKESEQAGMELDSDFKLNKKQEEFITKNIKLYTRIIAKLGNEPDAFIKEYDGIVRYNIPQDKVEELIHQHRGDKIDLFDNLPSGFVGSPIYSIRLVYATWEANRVRALRDKKKLLELRLANYRLMKENGTSDVTVEKEISYLQKKVTDIDYKLAKMEEGL